MPKGTGWKGSTAATKLVQKDSAPAIEFDKPGLNVVWLDGFEFSEGTLEFDAKGKSAPPQSSFIGVAFRVLDAKTHDAVYFRPFNFRSHDQFHAVKFAALASANHPDVEARARQLGADAFFQKSSDVRDLIEVARALQAFLRASGNGCCPGTQ